MNVRHFYLSLVCIIFCCAVSSAATTEKRNQLEELYIWKMSEELKLNAAEEKKFTDTIKALNKKKADLNRILQESIDTMAKTQVDKVKSDQLKVYKKHLSAYNRLSEEEVEKVQGLLGVNRTIQYLQIKQDLTNRIKSMLSSGENGGSVPAKTLPTPKVIEEK